MKKIVLIVVLFSSITSFACSCVFTEFNKKDYQNSAYIVKGKIVDITVDEANYRRIITFKVSKAYKGNPEKTIKIETGFGGGDCGLPVEKGDKWLLFTYGYKGEQHVGICGKNVRYNKLPGRSRKSRRERLKKMKRYIKKIKEYKNEE